MTHISRYYGNILARQSKIGSKTSSCSVRTYELIFFLCLRFSCNIKSYFLIDTKVLAYIPECTINCCPIMVWVFVFRNIKVVTDIPMQRNFSLYMRFARDITNHIALYILLSKQASVRCPCTCITFKHEPSFYCPFSFGLWNIVMYHFYLFHG